MGGSYRFSIISGAGAGRALDLPDAERTLSLGDASCDVPLQGVHGAITLRRLPDGAIALASARGIEFSVNGEAPILPRMLAGGDRIQIAATPPLVLELRDVEEEPVARTIELQHAELLPSDRTVRLNAGELHIASPPPHIQGERDATAALPVDLFGERRQEPAEEADSDRTVLAADGLAGATASAEATPLASGPGPAQDDDRTIVAGDAPIPQPPAVPPPAPQPEPKPPPPAPLPPSRLAARPKPEMAAPVDAPTAPIPPAASGMGTLLRIIIASGSVVVMLLLVGIVALLVWAPWEKKAPPATMATPATVTAPTPMTTPSPPPPASTPTSTGPRIARIEPPSAPAGSEVTIETAGLNETDDARITFGPSAARIVAREGGAFKVTVPELGGAPSASVVVSAGGVATPAVEFKVEAPPLPKVALRYEIATAAFASQDIATIYLGPVPLLVVPPSQNPPTAERAQLVTLNLEAARTALASSPSLDLAIAPSKKGWDIVVAAADAPPLVTITTVGTPELALYSARGREIAVERLAGHWMSVIHDAFAIGFGFGKPDRLPPDSDCGAILRKMVEGGLERGFAALTPEERNRLGSLAMEVPDAFAGFTGSYRGVSKLERASFPEVTWPNAELHIDLKLDPAPALDIAGQLKLMWVTSLDASGVNKTYQTLGEFPVNGRLDTHDLNRALFQIQHRGVNVPFEIRRAYDPARRAITVEGRYGLGTSFSLTRSQ